MAEPPPNGGGDTLTAGNYSQAPSALSMTNRPSANATKGAKEQNYLKTKLHVYPQKIKYPEPRPMSATVKARVERVAQKKEMLEIAFKAQAPPSQDSIAIGHADLPPYWSAKVHGKVGANIDEPKHMEEMKGEYLLTGIKKSLHSLRESLATIPWVDGRKVDLEDKADCERRIRAEVNDMEHCMREHIRRIADRTYAECKAPATTNKSMLRRAFERMDVTRTGDVTVQEFADVWNDADKGLHLMVPVLKESWHSAAKLERSPPVTEEMVDAVGVEPAGAEIEHDSTIQEVRLKRSVPTGEALKRWRACPAFPLWGGDSTLAELEEPDPKKGKPLLRPKEVLVAHAAAIFMKCGYDEDGLLPYDVFCNVLFTGPNRLLGMAPIKNFRKKGKHGFSEEADYDFDGKILYQRAKNSVFPPLDFDPQTAVRSTKMPSATLSLEHAYGYEGLKNYSNNLFYTDNPDEIVYYTAALGVVMNVVTNTQRFFHGHNDNIKSMACHPNDWIIATGQTKKAGPEEVPYVCVWETRECKELQRLHHPHHVRAVIAMGFSPDGERLVTVGADNNHSLFVWRWLTDPAKKNYVMERRVDPDLLFHWPRTISGTGFGPTKKIEGMTKDETGFFYKYANTMCQNLNSENRDKLPISERPVEGEGSSEKGPHADWNLGPAPTGKLYEAPVPDGTAPPAPPDEKPPSSRHNPDAWMSGRSFKLDMPETLSAYKGAPPQVYGVLWNPYAEDEFITYGVKHLVTWRLGPDPNNPSGLPRWQSIAGTFGPTKVENVLAAAYVPDCMDKYRDLIRDKDSGRIFNRMNASVTHSGKVIRYVRDKADVNKTIGHVYDHDLRDDDGNVCDPTDVKSAVLITGFPSGEIGIWIQGLLMRTVKAHATGPKIITPDGAVTYGGVCVVKLRSDKRTLLTGGADGHIYAWNVAQTVDDEPWMMDLGDSKQVDDAKMGAGMVKIKKLPGNWELKSPFAEEAVPAFRSLDGLKGSDAFIAGTNKNEIYLLREGGEATQLMSGATADLYTVATHPTNPDLFATAADNSILRVWDAKARTMDRCMSVKFPCRSVAFSQDGSHLAVGGKFGDLTVLSTATLQPLVVMKDCVSAIDVIKFSPNNHIMACGSHDLYIDCYDTGFRGGYTGDGKDKKSVVLKYPKVNKAWDKAKGGKGHYVKLARCAGHSASVCHLDFSLPDYNPPIPELRGKTLLMTNCNGYEILYWDPLTGRQILANPRNAKWATRTTLLGFDVMGIWPDGALNTSVNSLDRSNSQEYCVTGDNYSLVKLFNYPCVHDDAPWREFYGGASFITCVRFSCDDRRVVAVGGNDRTTFQYKTHGVNWDDGVPLKEHTDEQFCDVDGCLFCGRKPLPPPLPPLWGPLDVAGKTWGPCTVKLGKCSCANHELHMMQEFKKYDADGDGTISADELYQVMLGCGVQLTPQQLQDIIKEQDTDGDGTLRPEEFVKFWLTAAEKFSMEKTRKRMKEAFLKFDKDKDGQMTKFELKAMMASCGFLLTVQETEKLLADADTDQDGDLDYDEFIDFWMSRQQNEELLKMGGSVLKALKQADYESTGRASGAEIEKVLKQEMWAAGMQKDDTEVSQVKFQALKRTLTIDECDDATEDEELRRILSDHQDVPAAHGQVIKTGSFRYAAFVVGLVKHLSDEKQALMKRDRLVK